MSESIDVYTFHEVFHCPRTAGPAFPDSDLLTFRMNFIREEVKELEDAVSAGDLAETLDALCDLVWVTIGMAHTMNLPWREAWREVARSNMEKVPAKRPEDSKRGTIYDIVKPSGWRPPDIQGIIERALNGDTA
jgi:predicted HAD superfamily Cof-like phosphohydrolase